MEKQTSSAEIRKKSCGFLSAAVAGEIGYHLLMIGSPGTGKTLLAQRLGTILPDLSPEESLEVTRIWSAVGRLDRDQPLMLQRPFRNPHHTISEAGSSKCAAVKSAAA